MKIKSVNCMFYNLLHNPTNTLQWLNILVHILILRIITLQKHSHNRLCLFYTCLSTQQLHWPLIHQNCLLRIQCMYSQILPPTVSISFLRVFVFWPRNNVDYLSEYLYFQSLEKYLNLLYSPSLIWRFHPAEQSGLSKTLAQESAGILGQGAGPVVSWTL